MQVRDRILELRRVRADQLRANPLNWRTHPDRQRAAMRDLLAEIGYADALLARQLDDGTLELIDGHLRAETTPEAEVPVLVLDVNESEAAKLLATLDPLAAMAGQDPEVFQRLTALVATQSDAVRALLKGVAADAARNSALLGPAGEAESPLAACYQIVVECDDEHDQQALYQQLRSQGHKCKLLVI